MMINGHKTRDVFDRYHIVSDGDRKETAEKICKAFLGSHGHTLSHTGATATP